MFSRYYHSELAFMREMVREFSQSSGGHYGLMGERGGDPSLEQLLQGFAFLAARIHQRMEDESPEIIHEACEIVLPQLLRSIPSCTILEFNPNLDILLGRKQVDAHTIVTSSPIEGTSCEFRTCNAFELAPVTLERIELDAPSSSCPVLRLQMKTSAAGQDAVFHENGIRFYLHGDYSVATTLWLWLQQYCSQIRIRSLDSSGSQIRLPLDSLKPLGWEREYALFPWSQQSLEGFRLIQEYFTFPQKFLFFDLLNLDAAKSIAHPNFEIAFHLNKPPSLPGKISQDAIRLHCVPAVNIFSGHAKPVQCKEIGREHLLQVEGLPQEHAEIYTIESVTGRQQSDAPSTSYLPFASWERAAQPEEICPYYQIRREISHSEDGLDLYISASAPVELVPHFTDEQLTIPVTCTNRALAGRLRKGDLCNVSSAIKCQVTNIIDATKPVLPPLGTDAYWRFISHLSLGHHALQDVKTLQSLLTLYNFHTSADKQGMENRKRIEAISAVRTLPRRRVIEATAMRGFCTEIEIQEDSFACQGEAFLFGSVINHLLASRISFNSFHELSLRLLPSKISFAWHPTIGYQTVF